MFIPEKCNLYSSNQDGHIIVKLPDDPRLVSEIRTYLQTQKYIQNKSDAAASSSLKQILRDRAEQNRERRDRLTGLIEALLVDAEYYTLGKPLTINAKSAQRAIEEAFDYLILNVFSKFSYLSHIYDDPIREIKEILKSDDITQQQLSLEFENKEPQDIREIRTYIDLNMAGNKAVILNELVAHFARRPYGWGEFQTIVLIAKIFMAGNISLIIDAARIQPKDAFAPLTKTHQWKMVKIVKRKIPSEADIKKAQSLGKELFGSIVPDGQDNISRFIRDGLKEWVKTLEQYKPLADTGDYPGKKQIDGCLDTAQKILYIHDSYERIKAFNGKRDDLEDACDDLSELKDFYENQKKTWEDLRKAMSIFKVNQTDLEKNTDADQALKKMAQIFEAPAPYGMLKDVSALISTVQAVNEVLIEENRQTAAREVEQKVQSISSLLEQHKADDDLKNKMLYPLQDFKKKIQTEYSIPQITYFVKEAQKKYDDEWYEIEDYFKLDPGPGPSPTPKPKQVKTHECPVKYRINSVGFGR